MPIYEYRCAACDKKFEELVRSLSRRVKCPTCGSPKVEKQYSAIARPAGGRQGHG